MEQKTSNFQVVILIVFSFFIILGVALFSTSKLNTNNGGVAVTPVVMWGTLSSPTVNKYIDTVLEGKKDSLRINYVQKDPKTYEKDIIEAIADGAGPDIAMISEDMVFKNINKFATVPYATYPLRDFKDQFIDASSIFLQTDGIIAIPFIVDPMVMYWNKTHFVNAGIVNPPTEWTQFSDNVSKLTKKDSNFNVTQSGTALGEYQNIVHAKDILSMLFIQAGVPIVAKKTSGEYGSALYFNSQSSEKAPAVVALSFYTDFANPSKESYSWNKSLKPSRDAFISGETSIYFGFASELSGINLKNPNLNFDVSKVPQIPNTARRSVFAKMYGLAVLKSSKSQLSALTQIFTLTSKDSIASLTSIINLPPVRKDVLAVSPADPYMKTFYDSALMSETWLDPNAVDTEAVFKDMIESVIAGRSNVDHAVNIAESALENIIINNTKVKNEVSN